jgi:hypothetical protein
MGEKEKEVQKDKTHKLREGQGTKKQIVRMADIPRSICLSVLKKGLPGFSEILIRIYRKIHSFTSQKKVISRDVLYGEVTVQ